MFKSNSTIGILSFSLAMLISGSIGVFVQKLSLTAIDIVFFRSLIGTVFLGFYILLFNRKNFTNVLNSLKYIIICGIFLVLNWIFLFASFKHTSITIAVSIYYLAPVFVMLYGIIWLKEDNVALKIFTIILAFIGAAFASGIDINSFKMATKDAYGALFALIAALLYASLIITAKKIKDVDSMHISFIQTLMGAIILIFFIDINFTSIASLNFKILITLGVVHTAIMYILFFKGVKYAPIASVALLGFIDPLVAVMADTFILNNTISKTQWLGVGLIMFAIAIKSYMDIKNANQD